MEIGCSLLKKYDWKSTFCVSNLEEVGPGGYSILQSLLKKGHKVACHGFGHVNAEQYVGSNSVESYYETEVKPLTQHLLGHSIKIASYAYPYGKSTPELNQRLFKKFKILIGTTLSYMAPSLEKY